MGSDDPKVAATVPLGKVAAAASTQLGVPPASGPVEPVPTEITRLGRFEIRSKLGEGGMGEVLLATDPQLGRRVALKVLRREIDSSDARRRLLREAQGVAQLTHDNVIVVHEVGTHDGQDYIAMEYVAGTTLTKWQVGRPWREIMETYLRAGRGLAAAHDAGLVHRDFKPDNVLVADDGRVRVSDFGLVSTIGETLDLSATEQSMRGELELAVSLTRTGSIMGTPRYMAAEQHLGQALDARADQFSFCAALYEALYGQPPFKAESYSVLVARVLEGEIEPIPADHAVPPQIRDAIVRGLSRKREDRFPSMKGLLDALVIAPVTPVVARRRWIVPALAGGLALSAIVAVVVARGDQPAREVDASIGPVVTVGEWEARGSKLSSQRDYAGAADAYEHALEGGASTKLLLELANSYEMAKNCPALQKTYERYLAARAKDPEPSLTWDQEKPQIKRYAKQRFDACVRTKSRVVVIETKIDVFEFEEADFAADGTLATASKQPRLADLAEALLSNLMFGTIEVRAYVGTGDPATRQAVADRRANATVATLVQLGAPPTRLRAVGIPQANKDALVAAPEGLTITFDGDDRPDAESQWSLDRLAEILRADPTIAPVRISVELAMIAGDVASRKRRADVRAAAIRDALIARGIDAKRFELASPIPATDTPLDVVRVGSSAIAAAHARATSR